MVEPERIGKYEIRRTLGHGAMGTVYQGFDPQIQRMVAIKTISRNVVDADPRGEYLARFRNEARAAGRLAHPNIIGVYEYGEEEGVAYIAMEFVSGVDLRHYVHGHPGFGLEQTVALMTQLLSALEFAHACGIVHRDIKPSNLMISADGRLKVGDFGIARVDTAHLTATGMVLGTPAYMSPEQCQGKEADARADLFSAGVVMYELLTGHRPFDGPVEAIPYRICHAEPEPPSRRSLLALPTAIDDIVATALAKDPRQRFATARAFREALRETAGGRGDDDAMPVPMGTLRTPSRSGEPSTGNLPQQLTSFIGRERQLTDIAALLPETRLLSIVGAGGLGKTRLAVEAAARARHDFADGVWLVELAPLADGALVAAAVALVLGVAEAPGQPVREALRKHIHDLRLLLLLDNCEHLARACADLVKDLLQAGATVTIVATSREPLRVAGEQTYVLSSLSVPDPKQGEAADALLRFESVRLFADRAVAAQSGFRINDRNASAVAEICHRLDGIPLALELAAARVGSLPVEAIARRLVDRFRLLKSGDPTTLPRQQTLRAMIDWSHDLLSGAQKAVFRRLAVFAGDFALEAAEVIAAGGELTDEVLEQLSDLVEKSLVMLDPDRQRYRMLQTVRQYALERLDDAGETVDARNRHLNFYLALAEEADPGLLGPALGEWSARLDSERENLFAALGWCDEAEGGGLLGMRLVHALRNWLRRGSVELACRIATEALTRTGAQAPDRVRCHAAFTAGMFYYFAGRYDDARHCADESHAIARTLGDGVRVADALTLAGMASFGQRDHASAMRDLLEAVTLGRHLGDRVRLQQALNSLAEVEAVAGDLDSAEVHYEEALEHAHAMGARDAISVTRFNLARVQMDRGRATQAADVLRASFAYIDDSVLGGEAQTFLTVAAGLAVHCGEWDRAGHLYGLAQAVAEQDGSRREPADEAFIAPLVARARTAAGAAAFDAAVAHGRKLRYEAGVAAVRSWLATP
jgi:non-specific serine/threonine protein kinase